MYFIAVKRSVYMSQNWHIFLCQLVYFQGMKDHESNTFLINSIVNQPGCCDFSVTMA